MTLFTYYIADMLLHIYSKFFYKKHNIEIDDYRFIHDVFVERNKRLT